MMEEQKQRTNIEAGEDTVKYHAVKVGFLALGRALQSASHFEDEIKKEVSAWNEGFTFSMDVLPNGPSLVMRKENRRLKLLGIKKKADADLIVEIKNISAAFQMISMQAGAHHIYARHQISVTGNIADSMKLIRMLYIIEGYLFPKFLNKKVLKKSPKMTLKKHIGRLHIYTKGMILGM